MSTPALTLNLQFRRNNNKLISAEQQLQEIFQFLQPILSWSPSLSLWYLPVATSTSRDSALKQPAFDANGPTIATIKAVNEQKNEFSKDIRSVSIWNGANTASEDVSLSSVNSILGRPDSISLTFTLNPAIKEWRQGAKLIQYAVDVWPALFATFNPFYYSEKCVFKGSPGVGWMLYTPQVLTTQQVPEARALEPVMDKRNKQIGTIVVSVTHEQFSDENPEHVEVANAIEIRLADLDLLPRYKDL